MFRNMVRAGRTALMLSSPARKQHSLPSPLLGDPSRMLELKAMIKSDLKTIGSTFFITVVLSSGAFYLHYTNSLEGNQKDLVVHARSVNFDDTDFSKRQSELSIEEIQSIFLKHARKGNMILEELNVKLKNMGANSVGTREIALKTFEEVLEELNVGIEFLMKTKTSYICGPEPFEEIAKSISLAHSNLKKVGVDITGEPSVFQLDKVVYLLKRKAEMLRKSERVDTDGLTEV